MGAGFFWQVGSLPPYQAPFSPWPLHQYANEPIKHANSCKEFNFPSLRTQMEVQATLLLLKRKSPDKLRRSDRFSEGATDFLAFVPLPKSLISVTDFSSKLLCLK
jgi:hypothetical protein